MGAGVRTAVGWMRWDWAQIVPGLQCTLALEVGSHGLKMRCWLPFPETTHGTELLAQCVVSGKDASVNCICVHIYALSSRSHKIWLVRFFFLCVVVDGWSGPAFRPIWLLHG